MDAAIYCRVSTRGQEEEGTSLASQEEHCRQYAAARGYAVVEEHVYCDTHTGAELWERPRLNALREAVPRREVDAIIAYAVDRLSREQAHLYILDHECERAHALTGLAFREGLLEQPAAATTAPPEPSEDSNPAPSASKREVSVAVHQSEQRLLRILAERPMTRNELRARLNVSENRLRHVLDALLEERRIGRTGVGGKWTPFVYHLAEAQ